MKRSIAAVLVALFLAGGLPGLWSCSYNGPTLDEIKAQFLERELGSWLGYRPETEGDRTVWKKETEDGGEEEAQGWIGLLADLPVGDLMDAGILTRRIETATLGMALSMTERDGVWYTDESCTVPAAALLGYLADKQIGEVAGELSTLRLGYAFGFEASFAGEDTTGVPDAWLCDGVPVTDGIRITLADLTLADLEDEGAVSETCLSLRIADVFGYVCDEATGTWYTDATRIAQASALMQVIAGAEVRDIADTVDSARLGDLLGFVAVDTAGETAWYESYAADDPASAVPVSGILGLIGCDTTLSGMNARVDEIKRTETVGGYLGAGLLDPFTSEQTEALAYLYEASPLPAKPAPDYSWDDLTLAEFVSWSMSFVLLYYQTIS